MISEIWETLSGLTLDVSIRMHAKSECNDLCFTWYDTSYHVDHTSLIILHFQLTFESVVRMRSDI